MERAVIDRFEEEWAVLLVGDVGQESRMVNVTRSTLPRRAREGQWLLVELEEEKVVSAVIDQDKTRKMRRRIATKLERLRRGEHLKDQH